MQSPSRFLKDIDPNLLDVEEAKDVFGTSQQSSLFGNASYKRFQNSHPVASQFMADNKPREAQHHEDSPIRDTFSERFLRRYEASRGNMSRPAKVSPIKANTSSVQQKPPAGFVAAPKASSFGNNTGVTVSNNSNSAKGISENSIIKHERFGIGIVIRLEGSGENTKATVKFKNVGIKQLLLKFARFTVIG